MKRPTSPQGRLGLAVAIQLLLVGGLLSPAVLDSFGAQEIMLKTAPVDPRDLLRGQYLTLGYGVSRVQPGPDVKAGQLAYVPLQKGSDGLWTGERAVSLRPGAGVFLRGRVQWSSGGQVTLNYGIERFYLSEEAARVEEGQGAAGLRARVRVSPSGRARLLELWRENERIR
ncbi:GDYXXLXY domain-containing protein [Deinococcus sp. QL22]|uniref:GDYXXLXY domain-containing protein n=1 Tax=Deinococcus sp. QL22 TaxID=2939437 RepID=UPI0020177F90|nr:GDYXXLXY domain-containing protein [Deinococcus sp. QL22]UQN08485.1 GDYXXLXY domain-containing protein [Deinococcus sp. QL22]